MRDDVDRPPVPQHFVRLRVADRENIIVRHGLEALALGHGQFSDDVESVRQLYGVLLALDGDFPVPDLIDRVCFPVGRLDQKIVVGPVPVCRQRRGLFVFDASFVKSVRLLVYGGLLDDKAALVAVCGDGVCLLVVPHFVAGAVAPPTPRHSGGDGVEPCCGMTNVSGDLERPTLPVYAVNSSALAALDLSSGIWHVTNSHRFGIQRAVHSSAVRPCCQRGRFPVGVVDSMRLASLDLPVGVRHVAHAERCRIKAGCHAAAPVRAFQRHAFRVRRVHAVLSAFCVLSRCGAFNGADADGLRNAHITEFPICDNAADDVALPLLCPGRCPQRVRLFPPYHAAFQYVPEQDALVLRLADAENVRPIKALSALGGNESGVDLDGLDAQLSGNLRTDGRRHGFVIFVKEKIRLVLLQCYQVILEQLPADAAGLGLPVLRLGDAPMGAGGPAYE